MSEKRDCVANKYNTSRNFRMQSAKIELTRGPRNNVSKFNQQQFNYDQRQIYIITFVVRYRILPYINIIIIGFLLHYTI